MDVDRKLKFPSTRLCSACANPSKGRLDWSLRTKGEVFEVCSNWQSARTCIRRHAAELFGNRPRVCEICRYDKHAEICHRRAVSDFPSDSSLGEINAPENLVALCPNHHWEFDNGLLVV